MLDQIPEGEKERREFVEKAFEKFDPEKISLFKAFIHKEILDWAKQVPEGRAYPDTVATLIGGSQGSALKFLGAVIFARDRVPFELNDIVGMNFSKICRKYLDMDVEQVLPEYYEKFR